MSIVASNARSGDRVRATNDTSALKAPCRTGGTGDVVTLVTQSATNTAPSGIRPSTADAAARGIAHFCLDQGRGVLGKGEAAEDRLLRNGSRIGDIPRHPVDWVTAVTTSLRRLVSCVGFPSSAASGEVAQFERLSFRRHRMAAWLRDVGGSSVDARDAVRIIHLGRTSPRALPSGACG